MKRISFLSILVMAFLLLQGVQARAQQSFALCMGLSKCNTPGASDISHPQYDAMDLKKVLAKQGYKAAAITNKYATRGNILDRLRRIAAAAKSPDDKIVLYFATHGSEDGYFLTYGGEFIKYSEIIEILSKAKTRHIYCFVMACYSGSMARVASDTDWSENANKWGITFMVSSRPDEVSLSSGYAHWKHSFFGQSLIKGLRGQADRDGNKQITLLELFRYVYNEVTFRMDGSADAGGGIQHPQLIGPKSEHNAVLARW